MLEIASACAPRHGLKLVSNLFQSRFKVLKGGRTQGSQPGDGVVTGQNALPEATCVGYRAGSL